MAECVAMDHSASGSGAYRGRGISRLPIDGVSSTISMESIDRCSEWFILVATDSLRSGRHGDGGFAGGPRGF
jgi:hypothetical protein